MENNTLSLPKKTGDTVSIGLKLPNGIELRTFRNIEMDENVPGGTRKVKVNVPMEETFTAYGYAHPQNAAPHCLILDGYAITPGCPKAFWEVWLSQNKNSAMVKNGVIFAQNNEASVRDRAKDGKDIKSGMERVDPAKHPGRVKMDKETMRSTEGGSDRVSKLES